jgi:hypothetical protein
MTTWGRFFGSRDDVPGWARFFEPGAFRAFLAVLDAELRRRSLDYDIADGVLRLAGTGQGEYGLVNLAQVCNLAPRNEWTALVASHFDTLLAGESESASLDGLAADFEKARPLLKVRLYSDAYPAGAAVHRAPAPGVVAVLVYDLPNSVASVPVNHARRWGRADDDLFTLAVANVRAGGLLDVQPTDITDGVVVHALLGRSFFTATHALFLGDYVDAPHGALVGIPHRHAILFHPIADRRALRAAQSLIPATFGMYQEGPGSVSPQVYWWREGRFTCLPSRVTARKVEFAPPPEFVALLDRLG